MDTLASAPGAVNAPAPKPRRTKRDLYRSVAAFAGDVPFKGSIWPSPMPALSDAEAIKMARALWRRFFRGRWDDERPTAWPYGDTVTVEIDRRLAYAQIARFRNGWGMKINPARQGWTGTVHSLSHRFHSRLRPGDPGHGDNHADLERDMVRHVISSGWLDGALKPKPRAPRPAKPKPDPRIVAHDKVRARIKAWETKAKRAATALTKLRKEEAKLRRRRPLFTLD